MNNDTNITDTLNIIEPLQESPIINEITRFDNNIIPYLHNYTNEEKWWIAIFLGFIFAIVSSPAAYYITSKVTTSLGGVSLNNGLEPNFVGLLIHTLIFIIIIRIIMW